MALVEVEGTSVVTLTLNRPEARNALSLAMCDAIVDALEQIDPAVARVVILKGNGPAFCAGADFAAVSGPAAKDFLPAFERMLESVARFRLPTIASIHGAALGGGLQLATVCDFRLAGESAKLGIPSSRLGIVVNYENVERLVLLVGTAAAKEVLMTGRVFSGSEAVAAGLLTRSVPDDSLDGETPDLAQRIAALAPLSVRGAKRAIEVAAKTLGDARAKNADAVAEVDRLVIEAYASADLQEGLSAMAQKRAARFEGR